MLLDTCPAPASASPQPSWVERFRRIQPRLHLPPSAPAATIVVAGISIRLQFGNGQLREGILPAFGHLEDAAAPLPALTVFIHDRASAPETEAWTRAPGFTDQNSDIWLMDSPRLTWILHQQGRAAGAIDWDLCTAYWFVSDAASIPYLERAAPLRLLLSHWLGRRGRFLVHAAAVAQAGAGVLILGPGGAGKSSTALACLDSGMEYAADDHCLVCDDTEPFVHSLFGTGKLALADLPHFPRLVPACENQGRPDAEKSVFFFKAGASTRLSLGFPLRAILMAKITDSSRTTLRRMPEAAAFKALAPSCALHFPAARASALKCFNALVRKLPAYQLELGSERQSAPAAIRNLLEGAFLERPST